MPLGEMAAYWDPTAVYHSAQSVIENLPPTESEIGRGFAFMHPDTEIVLPQAPGKIYAGAVENPWTLVAGQVGFADDASLQLARNLQGAVEKYLDEVWHPVETQVAIHCLTNAWNGGIPNHLKPKVMEMMERVA
jgi:hypothetical protein